MYLVFTVLTLHMLSECSDYVVSTRHEIHIRVEYNVFPVVCIQQHIDYIHSVSVGNDAFHVLNIKINSRIGFGPINSNFHIEDCKPFKETKHTDDISLWFTLF